MPSDPHHASAAAEIATFEARKLSVVHAAYQLIAEKGFENLRTRDVAQKVGINVATLHYYFPSKQVLIAAVALYLASKFETLRSPPRSSTSASERIKREFADTALYLGKSPEMIEVMRELVGRARRDAEVAEIIAPLKAAWLGSVEDILDEGIRDGVFSAAIAPRDAARVIVAMLWGAATFPMDPSVLKHARDAVEAWLAAPAIKRGAKR